MEFFESLYGGSRNTVAVFIAQRCASVHYRRWYKFFVSKIGSSYERDASLIRFLNRIVWYDRGFDAILNRHYSRTLEEAAARLTKQDEAESGEQNRRRKQDLQNRQMPRRRSLKPSKIFETDTVSYTFPMLLKVTYFDTVTYKHT